MATPKNLNARTNATFRYTRDFSKVVAVYNMTGATIRMTGKRNSVDVYTWTFDVDAVTHYGVATAPQADIEIIGACTLDIDCVIETAEGVAPLFWGYLTLHQGVTTPQIGATATGVPGDTVWSDDDASTVPAIVQVQFLSALAATQAARDEAVAAAATVTASSLAAQIAALSASERNALFQALAASAPDAGTAPAGQAAVSTSGFFVRAG